MNKTIFIAALFIVMGLAACSDSEDTKPSLADVNGFAPDDNDNSLEAQIRRNFKEQTSCYLLFTDTLTKKQVSTDAFGKPVYDVELVDVNYLMMGYSSSSYRLTYKYIKDDERKQRAAEVVATKLGGALGKLTPFSFLVVDSVSQWKQNDDLTYSLYKKNPHPHIVIGSRCFVVSLSGDDAFEQDSYFNDMFEAILLNLLLNRTTQLREYWEPVDGLIDKSKESLGYERVYDNEIAKSVGFLSDWNRYYFCTSKKNDLSAYIHAVCTYSVADFDAEYANYPICVSRFHALRNYILSQGAKLNK